MMAPNYNKIRPIHPFGPKVGSYVPSVGTVAETIKRERNRLQAREFDDPFSPQWFKAVPHGEQ